MYGEGGTEKSIEFKNSAAHTKAVNYVSKRGIRIKESYEEGMRGRVAAGRVLQDALSFQREKCTALQHTFTQTHTRAAKNHLTPASRNLRKLRNL